MTEYYINEAILTFSGGLSQDSSINILRLSDPDAALIISRGKMKDEDELTSQIEQQLKKLETQVKELRYTPVQPVRLGVKEEAEGLEVQSQFLQGSERIYQYQVAWILPGSRVMMALTYSRTVPLTQADSVRWTDIKKTLRFRLTADATAE